MENVISGRYLTRNEAADYLGVSKRTIDRMRADGVFKCYQIKPSGKVLIPMAEIESHLRKFTRYMNRRKEQ